MHFCFLIFYCSDLYRELCQPYITSSHQSSYYQKYCFSPSASQICHYSSFTTKLPSFFIKAHHDNINSAKFAAFIPDPYHITIHHPNLPNALKTLKITPNAKEKAINTEQTYVDNLQLMNEIYYKPLKTSKILKHKQLQTLFGDVETINFIINLNSNLLSTLKESKNDKIGEAMLEFIPFLKMYRLYISNHEDSTKLLTNLMENNEQFMNFITTQRQKSRNNSPLNSFLILPIQRICRYQLCLNEIIKFTPSTHCDLDNLQSACSQICEVNQWINDRIYQFQQAQKVRAMEARFISKNISLYAPTRYFVAEGKMKKVSRKKNIKYVFLLFNDALIYCSECGPNKKLKLHQILEFDMYFKVSKIDNNLKYKDDNVLEIQSSLKSFLCICATHKERNFWFDTITQCLNKLKLHRSDTGNRHRILETAPVWIPDDFSDTCMIPGCNNKFTLTRRRHHCRYCGKLICASCSKNQLPHFNKEDEIVRIGPVCFDKYKHHFPSFNLCKPQRQRKRSSIIDLMQISIANKRNSLSLKKKNFKPQQQHALSPLPSICTHTNFEDSSVCTPSESLSIDRLPLSYYRFMKRSGKNIKMAVVKTQKFRVAVNKKVKVQMYHDEYLEEECVSVGVDLKDGQIVSGYHVDDEYKIVYLTQFDAYISAMDVREIGDDEAPCDLAAKIMQRPSKKQLVERGILLADHDRHKQKLSKTRVPNKKLPNLPDAMREIKRLSQSMSTDEVVCCKYVKREELKYWCNRSEPVDLSKYDEMIQNGMSNDFIAEQMKKNKVAPYWINKFFLTRVNENDLNADKMKKISQKLVDKQFVNEIEESLTERPSYFAELQSILAAKQKISECMLQMDQSKTAENEIYSVKASEHLYDINTEYDPFDAFEMDDFEYIDKEMKESMDSKTTPVGMPSNELMDTVMFDHKKQSHSFADFDAVAANIISL